MPRAEAGRIQAAYLVVTGLWPVAWYRSFEWLTGPKRDDWLVRTTGLLTAVIGLAIGLDGGRGTRQTRLLGIGSAATFAVIDLWYAGVRRRIRPIYLCDAAIQLAFLFSWLRR